MKIDKLINAYNKGTTPTLKWYGYNICKPTSDSIKFINKKLNIQLPESLIKFVLKSNSHEYLASLGKDYDSPLHIIQINKNCRHIRRRVIGGKGKWENVFPTHFVAINLGHDSDYDCLDLSKYNSDTGEYPIQYWAPPRIFGEQSQPDFYSYMESNLKYWGKL